MISFLSLRRFSYWFLATLFVLIACRKNDFVGSVSTETFPVTNPLVADTSYTVEYVANVHSVRNIELRARISGYLDRIYVDEGESVRKGQLLFSINGQEYREELSRATAMLKSAIADAKAAEVDLANVSRLVSESIVSEPELAIAQSKYDAFLAKVEEARAMEASARLRLSFADIRAPFDGIIDRFPNRQGSLIQEGDLLTVLSDNSQVFAYFNVSEREYLEYVFGREERGEDIVELVLADGRIYPFEGKIETVEGTIGNTGNIAFRARFDNPQGIIKHGASGKVRLRRPVREALIVPQKSTFEIQDKTFVYIVDDDNIVRMRRVVPRFRLTHIYVLASGLSPGDRILYEGIQRVSDGQSITPDLQPIREMLAHLHNSESEMQIQ